MLNRQRNMCDLLSASTSSNALLSTQVGAKSDRQPSAKFRPLPRGLAERMETSSGGNFGAKTKGKFREEKTLGRSNAGCCPESAAGFPVRTEQSPIASEL